MTFQIINGHGPEYLSDLLEIYVPTRSLRSATQSLLVIPRSSNSTNGHQAFSVAAEKLWTSLPESIRNTNSLDKCKMKAMTYFFPGRIFIARLSQLLSQCIMISFHHFIIKEDSLWAHFALRELPTNFPLTPSKTIGIFSTM